MNLILSIETSAKSCSVALSKSGHLIGEKESTGEWKHSKEITLLINDLLSQQKLSIRELNAVAVSSGPGSYTGLRVGTSCAKAVCFALNIPLISVDTLHTIALEVQTAHILTPYDYIIPTIDARREEVYFKVLNKSLEEVSKVNNHILMHDSFDKFPHAVICGDGAHKASKIIKNKSFNYFSSYPRASYMGKLAFQKYVSQGFENLAYYSPFYLKLPNITTSKKGILGLI